MNMGREKMKVQPQTNPQKVNSPSNKSGMEVFLTQSPGPTKEEKMKIQQANPQPQPQTIKTKPTSQQEVFQTEIERKIEELEEKLANIRALDLSTFNELIFKKSLQFKVLFIKTKIYVSVRDPKTNKYATISINPPKWGGTSLRFLISYCAKDWCTIVEKATKKGNVYSYVPISADTNIEDTEDIFET